jgi:hypothetical protein
MFLINQSSLGHALPRWETRALAARLAFPLEERPPLGKAWLTAFLLRHPQLQSRKYQCVEAKRLRAATKKNVGSWFDFMQVEAEAPLDDSCSPEAATWGVCCNC